MREAMAAAVVGDDVYAEDPTLLELEARTAALLGHEAGLFFPTGSMANMVGVRLLVEPGQELLADVLSHVLRAELGGHGALGGITTRTWSDGLVDGRNPTRALEAAVPLALMAPDAGPHLVSTAAVAVENTHNFGGGTVQPLDRAAGPAGRDGRGRRRRPPGRRPAVERPRRRRRPARASTARWPTRSRSASPRVSARPSARCSSPRPSGSPGPGCCASATAAACGRPACSAPPACTPSTTTSTGSPTTTPAPAGWPRPCAAARPGSVDPARSRPTSSCWTPGTGRRPQVAAAAAARGVRVSALGPRMVRAVTHLDVDDDGVERACEVLAEALAA